MSLPDRIIHELNQMDKPSEFQTYRDTLKTRPRLSPGEWSSLCRLVRTPRVYNILRMELSSKEAEVLGSALRKVPLTNVDDMIEVLVKKGDASALTLLRYILEKRKKIDTGVVQRYLCDRLSDKAGLRHLRLLHVVHKNYPDCIGPEVLDFCRSSSHPICREILASRMDVVE